MATVVVEAAMVEAEAEEAMAAVVVVVAVEVDGAAEVLAGSQNNHLLTRRRKSIGVHLLTGDRCPGLLSLYR